MADEEKDIITVGKRNDDNTAVWDRHEYHPSNYGSPEGEVFISDMRPYEVHRSRGIQQKIGEKELQELGERAATARTAAYDEEAAKKEEERKRLLEQREQMPGATFVAPGVVPRETAAPVVAQVDEADEEEKEAAPREGTASAPQQPQPSQQPQQAPASEEQSTAPGGVGGPQVRRPTRPPGS